MNDAVTTRVSEALCALRPPAGADEAAYPPAFRAIADLLLQRTTLYVAGQPHRLTEIELYWDGPGHRDPFTHGDPQQRRAGVWYFHRERGGAYKGGTFKGIDIAVGDDDTAAGVLIRGAMAADGTVLDGSCVFVDHVLARTGASSVAALAASFDHTIDPPPTGTSPLHLGLDDAAFDREPPRIFASARVGLTLKKGATRERQRFIARPYRFLSEPRTTRKGKIYVVLALHREGLAEAEIAALTGVPRAHVDRYIDAYRGGAGRSPESIPGEPNPTELCALLGACTKLWPW
ncbi:MAG: hypothetical protein IPO88_32650 [Nannocystis sp.]|uniref:helix-turn-helix domain-containing protein n=1 Tax=Nannocystis sp. TaxID=1962667 RepID=UPI002421D12A|nr:helix-turn-helix domain-containing protein [Nannocystis sp.]MBK9758184.1 hypothetical protein [Nannocystis sp.]